MSPKVYIPNHGGHNFDPAKQFGELVILTTGYFERLKINTVYRHLYQGLKDSHPDDYLVQTGLVQMNTVAAAIMMRLHGRVNLLIYNGGEYIPRTLDLRHIAGYPNHTAPPRHAQSTQGSQAHDRPSESPAEAAQRHLREAADQAG